MTSNGTKNSAIGKGIQALDDWLKVLGQFSIAISEVIEFFRLLLEEIKE